MRLVFMGTPDLAVPCLHALCASHDVVAVVTQPDRPSGRGNKLTAPPVKVAALEYGLPIYQFEKLNSDEAKAVLAHLAPDVIIVVAYGQILRPWLLEMPPFGCINVHASLLPRWRGAAPIQWAIVNGDTESGVTIMQMDKGIDTGNMLLKRVVAIEPTDTAQTLHNKLMQEGALALLEVLEGLETQSITPEVQDHSLSCYAKMIDRHMAKIDWHQPAHVVANAIRGFDPWPAAYTFCQGQVYKFFSPTVVTQEQVEAQQIDHEAFEVGALVHLYQNQQSLLIKAGQDFVAVGEIQAPGGKRMAVKAFLAGRPMVIGTQFDHVE